MKTITITSKEELDAALDKDGNLKFDGCIELKINIEPGWISGNIDAGNIKALNINARNIKALNINAGNIKALNINAGNIDALNIDAGNINARNIKALNIDARNIKALNINAGNINAGNIDALNIDAWDINARNIKARNIDAISVLTRTGVLVCEKLVIRSLSFIWPNDKKPVLPPAGAADICAWNGWHPILRAQLEMFFGLKTESTDFAQKTK
jgi:hypothetical protein